MKKLLSIVLLGVLCLSLFACFSGVQAATQVNGIIGTNTTWRQSGSPYQLTGPVCIPSGVTLTIESGVTVDFGKYYIMVNGTLQAQGTTENKIHFMGSVNSQNYLLQVQFDDCTSWNNQTGKGCILQHIIFDGAAISIQGSGIPVIADSIFYNQVGVIVHATAAEVIVTGNVFRDVYYQGLSVGKSSIVTNNLFNKTTNTATAIVAHGNTYVANNVITGFYRGITTDSTGTIENNVVSGCSDIGIWSINANAKITHNYVTNNLVGISGGGNIEANTITGNTLGIKVDSFFLPQITNNNIFDNTENSIVATTSASVNAVNNWWGTTNRQDISQKIKDYNDDFTLGTVNFEPILNQPNTEAPSSDALSSIGWSFSFFSYQIEADILSATQIVVASLGIGWAVIAAILLVKRFRR